MSTTPQTTAPEPQAPELPVAAASVSEAASAIANEFAHLAGSADAEPPISAPKMRSDSYLR